MFETQEFIDRCDVLLNEEGECGDVFEKYLREYLLSEDYDASITLFGIYLNKVIRIRIWECRKLLDVEALPYHLDTQKGVELCEEVKEWQRRQEEELLDLVNKIIALILAFYRSRQKEMPDGMVECFIYIGHALIYSAMMNNESFERNWYAISLMFALAYEDHIERQRIRSEFVDDYKAANQFINTYKIYLPFYYVAVWDLWKIGMDHNDERYEYNRSRLKEIVSELPDFYRGLLSGICYYPTKERLEALATGKGKNGEIVPMITRTMDVPFYCYLPAFVGSEPEFEKCRNGSMNEFFHPLQMLEIPCTHIFTHLDIELYLNGLYKEIEIDKMRRIIINYEPDNVEYADGTDNMGIKVSKQVSKTLNNMADLKRGRKEELLARLKNKLPKTAELVCKYENEKQHKDVIKKLEDAGYARKTYYDIKNLSYSGSQKSVPGKDTLIALACAFELTIEQTKELLFSSGYVFSPAVDRDVIIGYFIEKGMHNIVHINDFLDKLGMKIIEGKKKKD